MTYSLPIILSIGACALRWIGRVEQSETYHKFADRREKKISALLSIPNFNDVTSNLQYMATSAMLMLLHRRNLEAIPAYHVFLRAVMLIGPCSAYYHWNPNSKTLVIDRLAMSAAFGALLAHVHMPVWALWPSVMTAIATVAFWARTGDLRPYILLQYGGATSLLFTSQWPVVIVYAAAKVAERLDRKIYRATGISGHTFKHLISGSAPAFIRV